MTRNLLLPIEWFVFQWNVQYYAKTLQSNFFHLSVINTFFFGSISNTSQQNKTLCGVITVIKTNCLFHYVTSIIGNDPKIIRLETIM